MVKKITKSDLPPIPSIDRMANKINENFESIEGVQANLVLLANALKTAGILQ